MARLRRYFVKDQPLHVIQRGNNRGPIFAAGYLLTCMRYIELNPVRARMVRQAREYPWSSYRAHAHGQEDSLLRDHELYQRLGRSARARQAAYRALFKTPIAKNELEAIREATNKAWVLGDERFKKKVERLAGRHVVPLTRGRKDRGMGKEL